MSEETKLILAKLEEVSQKIDRVEDKLSNRIAEGEKFLLDEIVLNRNAVEQMIEKVQRNIEELNQYYRITKLENDNTAILLKLITQLQNDVDELKRKTA